METFRKYEEELEINDFPQQARWKVTSKVSIFNQVYYMVTYIKEVFLSAMQHTCATGYFKVFHKFILLLFYRASAVVL